MDWRCNAARAASSSRTASGTPRIVICTDMNAVCQSKQHSASTGWFGIEHEDRGPRPSAFSWLALPAVLFLVFSNLHWLP